MRIGKDNAKKFKTVVTTLKGYRDEVAIKVEEDYVRLSIIISDVAMGFWTFNKSFFEEFVPVIGTYTLKSDLFAKAITSVHKEGFEISILEAQIEFNGGNKKAKVSFFEGEERYPTPPEPASIVNVGYKDFADFIKTNEGLEESARFEVTDGTFRMFSKSRMMDVEETFDAQVDGTDSLSAYSFGYLSIIPKFKALFENVSIRFSTDYPLVLVCGDDDFEFKWLLGPRVENE